MCQQSVSFYYGRVFCCVDKNKFLSPFTLDAYFVPLPPRFSYHELSCFEHIYVWKKCFNSPGIDRLAGSRGRLYLSIRETDRLYSKLGLHVHFL